jgi:hypothetical protein
MTLQGINMILSALNKLSGPKAHLNHNSINIQVSLSINVCMFVNLSLAILDGFSRGELSPDSLGNRVRVAQMNRWTERKICAVTNLTKSTTYKSLHAL